jgi:hypothetical protein
MGSCAVWMWAVLYRSRRYLLLIASGVKLVAWVPAYSDAEGAGRMYIRKVGTPTHIYMVQGPKCRINISNEPQRKPNISNVVVIMRRHQPKIDSTNLHKCRHPILNLIKMCSTVSEIKCRDTQTDRQTDIHVLSNNVQFKRSEQRTRNFTQRVLSSPELIRTNLEFALLSFQCHNPYTSLNDKEEFSFQGEFLIPMSVSGKNTVIECLTVSTFLLRKFILSTIIWFRLLLRYKFLRFIFIKLLY